MWISFPYHLIGLAYAPLFAVERLPGRAWDGLHSSWRRRPSARDVGEGLIEDGQAKVDLGIGDGERRSDAEDPAHAP